MRLTLAALVAFALCASVRGAFQDSGEAFGKTRSLALAVVAARESGDAAAVAAKAEDLAAAARALEPDSPAARLARDVLAWNERDLEGFRALRAEVEGARAALELGAAAAAWQRVTAVIAATDPPGALALLNRPLSEFAKLASGLGHDPHVGEIVGALLASAETSYDAPWVAWYAEWLGQIEWVAGHLEIAARHFERAIDVRRQLGHADSESSLAASLALVRLSMGDLEAGLAHATRAEELARSIGDAGLARKAAHARAMSLYDLGELEAALALLADLDGAGRERDAVQLRLDLLRAGILQDVGRLESARTWSERALELAGDEAVTEEAPNLLGEALLAAGLLYGDLREFDQALATLAAAQRFFEGAGEPRGVAWTQKNRGWVLLDRGSHAEAETEFSRAFEYAQANAAPFLEGWCALGCAESASRGAATARESEVERWLEIAERRATDLHDLYLAARAASLRGMRASARGQERAAREHFETAVAAVERLRARFSLPGLLTHFLRDKVDPYRRAAIAAARSGEAADALRFAELSRARVLFEQRARGQDGLAAAAVDPRVQRARRALAQAESLLRATGVDREARAPAVSAAERELDTSLLEVELSAPREARLRGSPPPELDPERLARRLGAEGFDTLVEYVVGERESLAIVVRMRADEPELDAVVLGCGEEELGALVERLRAPIDALARGEVDLVHLGFDAAAARALHERLVAPLAPRLGSRIAIVPDGVLWRLPFEALISGGSPGRVDPARPFAHLRGLRFWIEDATIAYLPSAAILAADPRATTGSGLVLVANENGAGPMAVGGELAALRALRSERIGAVSACEGSDLARVEREASGARWLHFAAHGFVDERFPGNSHLVLGRAGDGLGELPAWQVEGWRLGARLVVLSACHGGSGEIARGEGVLSLTRSFLAAGAREVIASSWAVEDRATSALASDLWTGISAGAEPIDALHAAQVAALRTDDPRGFARAHPYFWAAWVTHRGE